MMLGMSLSKPISKRNRTESNQFFARGGTKSTAINVIYAWVLKLASDFEGKGGLVHKVCTLLQWDPEAGGGWVSLYSQTPF